MDVNRYFETMHNTMSPLMPGSELLATVKVQDVCGNDAYLELRRIPGERTSQVCYSTMGRRCLNFQLFRHGWRLCHNTSGQQTSQFPASADSLIDGMDFGAYCRTDRLDIAKTDRIVQELTQSSGVDYRGVLPQNPRNGAQITVESYLGTGARWCYWSRNAEDCLPIAAILYWLGEFLAGSERQTLQSSAKAAQLAAYWEAKKSDRFFCTAAAAPTIAKRSDDTARRTPAAVTKASAKSRSWQSVLAVMSTV